MHDTVYFVFSWWIWAALVAFGAIIGFAAAGILMGRKPQWTATRRVVTAAAVPAVLIVTGTSVGAGMVLATATPGDWSDLAVPAIARVGVTAALVAGAAALAAALLADSVAGS